MKLNEAFSGGFANFDGAEAAPEYKPVPAGVYVARVLSGEATTTRAGADVYLLKFEITEGAHVGRALPKWLHFSEKAIGFTKRDLIKLGINSETKLFLPFPEVGREYVVRLGVTLERGDDGTERNNVKQFDVLRVTDSPTSDFKLGGQSEGGQQ
jgi:hypothetical protein